MGLRFPLTPGPHVVLWFAVALAPATAVTALVTTAHKAHLRSLAAEWHTRGEAALAAADPGTAVEAFRTSLTYAREDRVSRLRLAQALAGSSRDTEARAYLLTLRQDQPGNGPVNLELARLAARAGDMPGALRYYHDAVEGAWPADAERQRRSVRLELIEWLVSHGQTAPAQSEIVNLAGDLPDDPALQKRVAGLMLGTDMARRALGIYQDVLRRAPRDADASAGAGAAAFSLLNDTLAERYLAQAAAAGHADAMVADRLALVRLTRAADPFLRRLPAAERAARTRRAVDTAAARLATCADSEPSAALRKELAALPPGVARSRHIPPETLDAAMELVFRIERFAATGCGPLTPYDRALLRMADVREEPAS